MLLILTRLCLFRCDILRCIQVHDSLRAWQFPYAFVPRLQFALHLWVCDLPPLVDALHPADGPNLSMMPRVRHTCLGAGDVRPFRHFASNLSPCWLFHNVLSCQRHLTHSETNFQPSGKNSDSVLARGTTKSLPVLRWSVFSSAQFPTQSQSVPKCIGCDNREVSLPNHFFSDATHVRSNPCPKWSNGLCDLEPHARRLPPSPSSSTVMLPDTLQRSWTEMLVHHRDPVRSPGHGGYASSSRDHHFCCSITSPSLFLISVQSAIPLLVPSAVGGK